MALRKQIRILQKSLTRFGASRTLLADLGILRDFFAEEEEDGVRGSA